MSIHGRCLSHELLPTYDMVWGEIGFVGGLTS